MISIIELGYYHPSNANWSYHIHLILDKTGGRLYKETFGGDSRLIRVLESNKQKVERVFIGKGSGVQYKWRDIKDLPDIESYKINWPREI